MAAPLPEDVRQALADLEEETRRLKEYTDRKGIVPEEAQEMTDEGRTDGALDEPLGEAKDNLSGRSSGESENVSGAAGETSGESEEESGAAGVVSGESEDGSDAAEKTSAAVGDESMAAGKAADEPEKVSDEPENVSGGSGQGADPAAVPQESFSISDLLAGRRSGISGKEDVP